MSSLTIKLFAVVIYSLLVKLWVGSWSLYQKAFKSIDKLASVFALVSDGEKDASILYVNVSYNSKK